MDNGKEVLEFIKEELKEIKIQIGSMREIISAQIGNAHARINDVVKERHECELACKEREAQSKERESDLKERIWKTGGAMAGAVNILVEGVKWLISKVI